MVKINIFPVTSTLVINYVKSNNDISVYFSRYSLISSLRLQSTLLQSYCKHLFYWFIYEQLWISLQALLRKKRIHGCQK